MLIAVCCSQAAMMSIAYKEGVSFPPAALNKVIVAANQDIRQVLLLLVLLLLLLLLILLLLLLLVLLLLQGDYDA